MRTYQMCLGLLQKCNLRLGRVRSGDIRGQDHTRKALLWRKINEITEAGFGYEYELFTEVFEDISVVSDHLRICLNDTKL